ncbi:MAG: DUF72 domain-containing protein [Thermoleophilia bacterium]|nr:DUF72 domain-containing protein [Thermoleophilia bacterium]
MTTPGRIRAGTCSWTDRTMVEAWYPPRVKSAADRLRYYAQRFDTVEVDSTFYGLPSERNAALWAERTPPGFVFHIKAFAMLTRHGGAAGPPASSPAVDVRSASRPLRAHRPPPAELRDTVFAWFSSALAPLRDQGKLGLILLQFPPYFVASEPNRAYIAQAVRLLAPDPTAVEFRHASWVKPQELPRTLDLLTELGTAYVGVDEPRLQSAGVLPPITAATSTTGYVRFHGRNAATWKARVDSAAERFKYLYTDEELAEWLEPLHRLSEETHVTYAMFNNCYADYAPRNAQQLSALLGLDAPV